NVITLLHAFAVKANDYTKKSHVFRLHTCDSAQYLIQTSDMKDCQEWIDAINIIASIYSSP
ncbi:hypothetical protein HELRODRAFT_151631, partial [Helobdella robusta]|uniref:PH domain-containing protein n=1 Tax=Helobdella robusta TaxID=6412 RepID=T1EKL3_HELRO